MEISTLLIKNGKIDYNSLVTVKKEDFMYFTVDDFVNIIGSEDIKLFSF